MLTPITQPGLHVRGDNDSTPRSIKGLLERHFLVYIWLSGEVCIAAKLNGCNDHSLWL